MRGAKDDRLPAAARGQRYAAAATAARHRHRRRHRRGRPRRARNTVRSCSAK